MGIILGNTVDKAELIRQMGAIIDVTEISVYYLAITIYEQFFNDYHDSEIPIAMFGLEDFLYFARIHSKYKNLFVVQKLPKEDAVEMLVSIVERYENTNNDRRNRS